jgi:LacI family transcriptional regulator
MASIRQIAESTGVSVATVSRALNNRPEVSVEMRDRVWAEAERVGYRLNARSRATNLIGLAYPGRPVNAEFGGFDAAIVSGVTRGVNEARFDVALVNIDRDKLPNETFSQFFRRKGLQGVVLRSFADTRHICEAIADEGFPSVVVADRFENPRVNYIYSDSYGQSCHAVEHLIHLGHRRIGMCIHMVADSDHADRRRAYEQTLQAHGIPLDPSLTVEVIGDMAGGAAGLNRLMSLPQPPTALYLTDPLATLGALRRALELSIDIPGDLSIVGFDDSAVRKMAYPVYTAVCQDAMALGVKAAEWLTRRLSNSAETTFRVKINTMFEVNQTTGVPPETAVRILPDGQRLEVR